MKIRALVIGIYAWMLVLPTLAQESIYYSTAFGTKDEVLKQTLHNLISNHQEYPYTSSSTDVWDILKVTDRDSLNPNNVILIYSGRSVNAAQEYNSGSGWSREHVWAKSRGDFGTSPGPGTDVHHLRPCDVSVNSTRNNRNFDNCKNCQDVIDNGFNTGSKKDASLWTFEPPDAVKGDVARMILYMAIRYEGTAGGPDLELSPTLLDKSSKEPKQAKLATLLEWNRIDPVSNWERNRNEIIFSNYQGNRNPLIDHPELAEYLWGDSIGIAWMPSFPTALNVPISNSFQIYPNPTTGWVYIEGSYSQLEVYDVLGNRWIQKNTNIESSINLSFLSNGVYVIRLTSISGKVTTQRMLKN